MVEAGTTTAFILYNGAVLLLMFAGMKTTETFKNRDEGAGHVARNALLAGGAVWVCAVAATAVALDVF